MKRIKQTLLFVPLFLLLAACGGTAPAEEGSEAGELEITDITANLALPTDTGAIYMLITNNTAEDDALIGAAVPGCGTIELHEMSMEDDVMIMREVDGGEIPIPAGETVTLERGGLHVMCIDKAEPTAAGEIVPVTLEFANAGTIEVEAEAIDVAAPDMDMDMDHGDDEMDGMDMDDDDAMDMDDGEEMAMDDGMSHIGLAALMADLPAAEPDLTIYPVTSEYCDRELTFDAPPQQVVSLWQPSNEILLALGVTDNIAGFAGMYDVLPPTFADSAADVEMLGTGFDFPTKEVMVSLAPDLVVSEGLEGFAFDPSQGYATVEELEEQGTQVYSTGSSCLFSDAPLRGLDAIFEDIELLGQIFGVSERADELYDRLLAREEAVTTAVSDRDPVKVAFFNGDEQGFFVLTGGIWGDMMQRAGGEVAFFTPDATFQMLSLEEFAVSDADVILYGMFPPRETELIEAYLMENFPDIPAVVNGRLFPINTIETETSVRALDGLEAIAQALHPEAFE